MSKEGFVRFDAPFNSRQNKSEPEYPSPKKEHIAQSTQVLDHIQELVRYALALSKGKEEQNNGHLQYRDRKVHSKIKTTNSLSLNDNTIEEWIGEVCRSVASTTFHNYLNDNFTFEQAKVYCCQEILRNISRFAENNQVDAKFFTTVDKIMKEKVMPYLAQKYPLNQSTNVNKTLDNMTKEINNIEELSNDFIYNSEIIWEYRENGNYNDLIMRLINEIISIAESPTSSKQYEPSEEVSNYKDFDTYITHLFDKIQDPLWIKQKKANNQEEALMRDSLLGILSQKQIKKQFISAEDRQKYKEKVQEYTIRRIGRKIPESILPFTEDQIKSKQLTIKSPQILRIITKWCKELWEKFEDQNYFVDRTQGLSMLNNKDINFLYQFIRKDCKQRIQVEKKKITKSMAKVEQNLYQQQYKIMQSELLSKQASFLDRYERICGKFSTKVVNNLKNCIVVYLNRIIHGLMFVSHEYYREKLQGKPSWTSAPNFLSFKIGDILRARISSHEKEIVKLYEQIIKISQNNPEKMKIIRVKNRLKTGTNDLLINVRFNNSFTSELQIKIKSKEVQSKFSRCSYSFSHFIYEILRSYFGPISEICSIWYNLDSRTETYKNLVQNQNLIANIHKGEFQCLTSHGNSHQMESIANRPFICNNCGKSFSSDNFALPHESCALCNYYSCALCQIGSKSARELMEQLVIDENLRENLFPERCLNLPSVGVSIKIEDSIKTNLTMFKALEWLDKVYIFFVKDNNVLEFAFELKTKKEIQAFLKERIVYEFCGDQSTILEGLTQEQAFKKYITPKQITQSYNLEKQKIAIITPNSVEYDGITMKAILEGPIQSKKRIKKLYVSSQKLENFDCLPKEFVNLEYINANVNKLNNLDALINFKKLHSLYMVQNPLSNFPVVLCDLPLKILSLKSNRITFIPPEIQKLQTLEILRLSNNQLQIFPLPLTKLVNLTQLFINKNKLKTLPQQLKNLTKLKLLDISDTQLKQNPLVLEQLQSLEILNLSQNLEQKIQSNLGKNQKLKELDLSENNLTELPITIKKCNKLSKLDLNQNEFKVVDFQDVQMPNITEINLSNNSIKQLSSINNIKNILDLNLSDNQLEELPQQFCDLTNLRKLNLQSNLLKKFPDKMSNLKSLLAIDLSNNPGICLPNIFSKLKIEKLIMKNCALSQFFLVITDLKHLKQLNIEENNITSLPEDLKQFKNVEVFLFANNNISTLPTEIVKLTKLKKITYKQKGSISSDCFIARMLTLPLSIFNFEQQHIEELPLIIPKNQKIEDLAFRRNMIKYIPDTIDNLFNIKELDLCNNKLVEVSKSIFNLINLTSLDLSVNLLENIPDNFGNLHKLTYLDISENKLISLPESLKKIYNRSFNLTYNDNPITDVPLWLIQTDFQSTNLRINNNINLVLPRLTALHQCETVQLNQDQLNQIPPAIFVLSNLSELNVRNNRIAVIPSEIKKLIKLTTLLLSNNMIKIIPNEICDLPLKIMEIDNNPLETIATNFVKLEDMALKFSPSAIKAFKKEDCLQYMRQKIMFINKMSLTSLPDELGEVTTLQNLDISCNELTCFPEVITSLKQLKILTISEQSILILSSSISNLSNLTHLIASKCEISEIPSSIGSLYQLETLVLSQNCISNLPLEIKELKKIKQLHLDHNNLTSISQRFLALEQKQVTFDLSNNKIQEIPIQFTSISFEYLGLSNNKIEIIPGYVRRVQVKVNNFLLDGNPIKQVRNYFDIKNKFRIKTANELFKFYSPIRQIPSFQNSKCWKCQSNLSYPCYWLRWEDEENIFGCKQCVEEKSLVQGHHYAYENNSVLLFGQWQVVCFRKMGNNIQPKEIITFSSYDTFCCSRCRKSFNLIGQPRYHCLGCKPEATLDNESLDLCELCKEAMLSNEAYQLKKLQIDDGHENSHPLLRVLYNVKGYYDY